jgi:hypothetical protein
MYIVTNDADGTHAELIYIRSIFCGGRPDYILSDELEETIIEPILVFKKKEDAEVYKQACVSASNQHEDAEGNERINFTIKRVSFSRKKRNK